MILVTGATGIIGRAVLHTLASNGVAVRGLTRGDATTIDDVEIVTGDLDHPESLRPALNGTRAVFLLPGFADMTAVADELARAGVEHVVLLSGISAAIRRTSNAIANYMSRSERAVRSSGLAWTILRPAAFMSNTLRWAPQLAAGDVVEEPFADIGAAVIDPVDIAAVAAHALADPGTHEGQIHTLSGPQPLRPVDRLATLAAVLGRPLQLRPLATDEAHQRMTAEMPAAYVDAFFDFYVNGSLDESVVYPTVPDILGRPARTFDQWATANQGAFR